MAKCLQMENINVPYNYIQLQTRADCICLIIWQQHKPFLKSAQKKYGQLLTWKSMLNNNHSAL